MCNQSAAADGAEEEFLAQHTDAEKRKGDVEDEGHPAERQAVKTVENHCDAGDSGHGHLERYRKIIGADRAQEAACDLPGHDSALRDQFFFLH